MLFQVQPIDLKDNKRMIKVIFLYVLLPYCSRLKGVYTIMSQIGNI